MKKNGSKKTLLFRELTSSVVRVGEESIWRVGQGMVRFEAGTVGSCQIMKHFVCHAQKFILKAMSNYKPRIDMVKSEF